MPQKTEETNKQNILQKIKGKWAFMKKVFIQKSLWTTVAQISISIWTILLFDKI